MTEEAKWQIVSESGTGMEASVERPHVTSSHLVAKINHGTTSRTKGKNKVKDRTVQRAGSCDCAVHSRGRMRNI